MVSQLWRASCKGTLWSIGLEDADEPFVSMDVCEDEAYDIVKAHNDSVRLMMEEAKINDVTVKTYETAIKVMNLGRDGGDANSVLESLTELVGDVKNVVESRT